MENLSNSQNGRKNKPKITKDLLDKFFNSRNNLKDSIPSVKQAEETAKDIIEENKDIDLQEKLGSKRENKKNGLKPKPEEDKPKGKKNKSPKNKPIKELESETIESDTIEEAPAKEQKKESVEKVAKIINIEQLNPQELGEALESLKTTEGEPDIKALTEVLERFTSYLHGLLQNLNIDDLEQELLRISSVKNIIDQMMPFDWDRNSDVECNALYAQILRIGRAYEDFKREYDNLLPPIDKSLEEIARNVHIEVPKVEERIKSPYDWGKQVDAWVEEKIQREMKKLKTDDRMKAEECLKDKFKRVLPHIFREFAVHGTFKDEEFKKFTDLDGGVCLELMRLTGFKIKEKGRGQNLEFIRHEQRKANAVNLDVGYYEKGVAFLEKTDEELRILDFSDKEKLEKRKKDKPLTFFRNLGLIIDHHPEGAPSTAGILFKLLDKLAMFDGPRFNERDLITIKKVVEFVDLTDSRGFQEVGKPENWNQSSKTVLGLYRYFRDIKKLFDFFYEDGNFYRPLTEKELWRYGLIHEKKDENGNKTIDNASLKQRDIIDKSSQKLKELEAQGFIIDTKFGKIVIDAKKELVGGIPAAQSIGVGYLGWDRNHKRLVMFSDKELDKNLFENGIRIRHHMWIMPRTDVETGLTLNEVIKKIEGKVIPGSELEKYLNSERKR